jgi:dolichol-phosphate mannosyltransferase
MIESHSGAQPPPSAKVEIDMISLVIPIYNEVGNILPLYEGITDVLLGMQERYEILFVDDGSTDGSSELLARLAEDEETIKVIHFRRNFGQTAAMMAGIDHSSGNVVIPMDGDGQNDPADIPRLLDKLAEGYDVVSGWRANRQDKKLSRVFVSQLANRLISRISGVHLHDYGCSLKAYRREVIDEVRLYGEMHRFIPIYASWHGARVTEIPVNHSPRTDGRSKYGLERVLKVVLDLMVVQFLGRYETKPIYVFGGFGLACWGLSLLSGAYAVYLKYFEATTFIQTPLPLLAAMTFVTGVLSILMGFLAEIMVRTYYESQEKKPYAVLERRNLSTDPPPSRAR